MTANEYNDCVDRYADGIYRFVLKMSANEADAKDTVQNSFEKLWKRYDEVNIKKAKAFLFTTAYRDWIDQTRKIKRMHFTDDLPESGINSVHEFEEKEIIEKAFIHISATQKSVILLRDYEGYSYEEISEITGLNLSQVKVYIFRGRKKLQVAIKDIQNDTRKTQM